MKLVSLVKSCLRQLLAFLLVSLVALSLAASRLPTKLNLRFILSDDQRWDTIRNREFP